MKRVDDNASGCIMTRGAFRRSHAACRSDQRLACGSLASRNLWSYCRRCTDGFTINQPVQQVQNNSLGRDARLQRHRHGIQNRFLVVLQRQCEELYHFPVTARPAKQVLLKPPDVIWQLQERRANSKRSRPVPELVLALAGSVAPAFRKTAQDEVFDNVG